METTIMSNLNTQFVALTLINLETVSDQSKYPNWSLVEWYDAGGNLFSGWIAAKQQAARAWVERSFADSVIVHCYDANPNPGCVAIVVPQDILPVGTLATFTYSMTVPSESDAALHALHVRSGQTVTVLGISEDGEQPEPGSTLKERAENGMLCVYRIKFHDGHIGTAFEDELD